MHSASFLDDCNDDDDCDNDTLVLDPYQDGASLAGQVVVAATYHVEEAFCEHGHCPVRWGCHKQSSVWVVREPQGL